MKGENMPRFILSKQHSCGDKPAQPGGPGRNKPQHPRDPRGQELIQAHLFSAISPKQVISQPVFLFSYSTSLKSCAPGIAWARVNSSITAQSLGKQQFEQNTQQPRQRRATYQPIPTSPGLTRMLKRVKRADLFSKNRLHDGNRSAWDAQRR